MAKKCTKKRDARAKLLFGQSRPIAFLPSVLVAVAVVVAQVPYRPIFPPLLSNSPTSLCESFLVPVSYSFLKRRKYHTQI